MLTPKITLLIGTFCGLLAGYSLGFMIARIIYRRSTSPTYLSCRSSGGKNPDPASEPGRERMLAALLNFADPHNWLDEAGRLQWVGKRHAIEYAQSVVDGVRS